MKLRRNKLVPIALEASPGIESSEATYTQRIEQLEVLRVKALESAELATPLARCVNLPEQLLREYSEFAP